MLKLGRATGKYLFCFWNERKCAASIAFQLTGGNKSGDFLIYAGNLLEASLRFFEVGLLFIATVSQASGSLLLLWFVSGQTRKEFEL
jgi:hypothetical protein